MPALPASGPSQSPHTACFSVYAFSDPSVMPCVLEVFAKRGMVPTTWHSSVCGYEGEELHIDIQVVDMDAKLADRLALSLRQLVCVSCVLTSEKRYAISA